MNENLKLNKTWKVVLVSFLACSIIAGVAVGGFLYFSRNKQEKETASTTEVKKTSATEEVDTSLANAEKDIKAADDLDTSDVDAALNDLNSIDLSGV